MSDPTDTPLIPDLVFTVAITGHQDIAPAQAAALQTQITGLLETIRARICTACAPGHSATNPFDAGRATRFRFVTALAPGADQIGARAALATTQDGPDDPRRWRLNVILPFDRDTYAALARATLRDKGLDDAIITAAIEAIDTLAAQADRVLELTDRASGVGDVLATHDRARQSRRYATLGQMLVRQADLLIALWDGAPARGPGGTAEVVSEARRSGVPVVWIDPARPGDARSFVPDAGTAHPPISGAAAALDRAVAHVLHDGGAAG